MAVINKKIINGIPMGIDTDNEALRMLMTDDQKWMPEKNEEILSDKKHKEMILHKFSKYVEFLEKGMYKDEYPDLKMKMVIIELHFKYTVTENGRQFIQEVQDLVGKIGIKIEAHIG